MSETEMSFERFENRERWPLNVETDAIDQVAKRIQQLAESHNWTQVSAALDCAFNAHAGQRRRENSDGKPGKPYIIHPLSLTSRALSLDLQDEQLLAALLLHDVVEDTPVTLSELPVDDYVRHIVDLVSFSVLEGETKPQAKVRYFQRLAENNDASMVKLIDRSHNLTDMTNCFSAAKKQEYIAETQQFILPLAEGRTWRDEHWARAADTVCQWIEKEIKANTPA